MIISGFVPTVFVANWLLQLYIKCGHLGYATKLFDKISQLDVMSWNAMIFGNASNRMMKTSRRYFDDMPEKDANSWNSLISGYLKNGNALVDFYGKCRRIDDSIRYFYQMAEKNWVSWSAVIAGCVENGKFIKGVELFKDVQSGVARSIFAWSFFASESIVGTAILDMYAKSGYAQSCQAIEALQLFRHLLKSELGFDEISLSTLMDMYSKCGNMYDSKLIFEKATNQDFVTWNAMICGYAQHGLGEEALQIFEDMIIENVTPNHATFVSVLRACAHIGLVEKGLHYFAIMSSDWFSTSVGALFLICKIHGNVEEAEKVIDSLLRLDPQDSSAYILLSNIYTDAGLWDKVSYTRKTMRLIQDEMLGILLDETRC
ncbi:hypothetical protein F3Y22_tig00003507pilonHSYRG00076 [Hibiscus syriacus]|uniref:Pentatricopeptide repeat-containing protein n=1 Tax=Hibiscus syriacus TaxID=106335 RepID=A0A6A3CJP7_HIBSY|nr:hypothetical protein F3Y22_tig00003507pilonHSYRG00076 [Hibiscus syriacus]